MFKTSVPIYFCVFHSHPSVSKIRETESSRFHLSSLIKKFPRSTCLPNSGFQGRPYLVPRSAAEELCRFSESIRVGISRQHFPAFLIPRISWDRPSYFVLYARLALCLFTLRSFLVFFLWFRSLHFISVCFGIIINHASFFFYRKGGFEEKIKF